MKFHIDTDTVLTSFSDRLNSLDWKTLPEFIRERVERRNPSSTSAEEALHDIVEACLEFQPTFSVFGRQLTYQDAFSGEIARIVSSFSRVFKASREANHSH